MKPDEDVMIERIAGTLRTAKRFDASFDERVMARVRALPAPRRRLSLWRWLMEPRSVAISPIGGLAFGGAVAALLFVAATVGGGRGTEGPLPPAVASSGEGGSIVRQVSRVDLTTVVVGRTVQFALAEPAAGRVAVVGDFNDWNPEATMMQRSASGAWTISLPLEPGRYTYNFLIDGERWVADPSMPVGPVDEFLGRPSSVVTVGDGNR